MERKLANICETYINNRDEMRRILRSSGIPMHLMGAAVLTALGSKADEEKILAAEELLKEREPIDSPIRGAIKSVTTVHMQLASDMQDILFLLDRTGLIHEGMGKGFASLKDKSGYVTAAFAAACGITNTKAYLEDVERCMSYLKESGVIENVSEDLGMLLALIPLETEEKCKRVLALAEAFKAINMDFEHEEEAGMLGFLAALDMPADEIAAAVYEADEFLKLYSGFVEGTGCILRHVYASMLVMMTYAGERSIGGMSEIFKEDSEALKRMVLMQSQSVMHIQMQYVDVDDLHI